LVPGLCDACLHALLAVCVSEQASGWRQLGCSGWDAWACGQDRAGTAEHAPICCKTADCKLFRLHAGLQNRGSLCQEAACLPPAGS
jgi:hypothetical protein